MKHLKYLSYVIRHKWFVFLECCKLGIPYLGIIHDISKFKPSEWFPYTEYFYGNNEGIKKGRDETGYYQAGDTIDEKFNYAWLLHQKRNKHHWQWWVLPMDDGSTKIFDMPLIYKKEMMADWFGAGRAQGTPNTKAWYKKNRDKMKLHPKTREWVEKVLKERV
jgi:hypothetical protein